MNYELIPEHREEARAKANARAKAWRIAHPERAQATEKAYRLTHLEEIRFRNKVYHAAHREEASIKAKAYRIAHQEEKRTKAKVYNALNRKEHQLHRLKKKYGLSELAFNALLDGQGSACAICKKPVQIGPGRVVDHSHINGEVRGILCRKCNLALGMIDEDLRIARRMTEYLEKSNQNL